MCIFKFFNICYLGFSVGLRYKILISNLKSSIINLWKPSAINIYANWVVLEFAWLCQSITDWVPPPPSTQYTNRFFFLFKEIMNSFNLNICYTNECYCFDHLLSPTTFSLHTYLPTGSKGWLAQAARLSLGGSS